MTLLHTADVLVKYLGRMFVFTVYGFVFRFFYIIVKIPAIASWPPVAWFRRKMEEFEHNRNKLITTTPEQWMHTIGNWASFKSVAINLWYRAFEPNLKEGDKAIDVELFQLHKDGSTTKLHLLDFAKTGRPYVVNFGSCTCPSFWDNLRQFGQIVEDYKSVVDFAVVYIREMHPQDEWAMTNPTWFINQPKTDDERFVAARSVQELGIDCPLLVDPINDQANIMYKALPDRVYGFQEGRIQYIMEDGPFEYDLGLLLKWLNEVTKRD